jgi:hypothetical protein
MEEPKFKNGELFIEDYSGRQVILAEKAWKHIIIDRNRTYFEQNFKKIKETLQKPDHVRESTQEKNVVIYERFFDDFYITNSVLGRAYIDVVVNWSTNRIRSVYPSLKKRQRGRKLWPKEQ